MSLKRYYLLLCILIFGSAISQEGQPILAKQWFDVSKAPNTQSANLNFRIGDKMGFGSAVYVDGNGRFKQTGVYLTYAYHLLLSRDRSDLNMVSFGISPGFIQSSLDISGIVDPVVGNTGRVKDGYFNIDLGTSYHFKEFYAHFTIKNVLPIARNLFDNTDMAGVTVGDSSNQRRFILSLGQVFPLKGNWSIEPSGMLQVTDRTKESTIDGNLKLYYAMNKATLWGGLSYRRSIDGTEFSETGTSIESQKLQYLTPFIGVNYKKWLVGYTYSYQSNSVVLSNGGFHQITLGYDFGIIEKRWDCNCPAINTPIVY